MELKSLVHIHLKNSFTLRLRWHVLTIRVNILWTNSIAYKEKFFEGVLQINSVTRR